MKYLLDTNVCIKILKGNSEKILEMIRNIDNNMIIIPSIVRYELFYGAYKSTNKDKNLLILKALLGNFSDRYFDSTVSEICGKVRAELDKTGTPIGPYDLQIGAIALADNLTLVTHNVKEFSRIQGLRIEDWE